MNRIPLTRSVAYWLLLILSIAVAAVGFWLALTNTTMMTQALLDGTATGIEVYVGQPLIVVGAVLLGAGIVGILLALTLAVAARTFSPAVAQIADEDSAAVQSDAQDAPIERDAATADAQPSDAELSTAEPQITR